MLHSTGSLKFRKWEIDGANGELVGCDSLNANDVGFLNGLLDELLEAYPIDPQRVYPYSDTCRTWSSILKVYGGVKNYFPVSLAIRKPPFYACKFGQHTKVTL